METVKYFKQNPDNTTSRFIQILKCGGKTKKKKVVSALKGMVTKPASQLLTKQKPTLVKTEKVYISDPIQDTSWDGRPYESYTETYTPREWFVPGNLTREIRYNPQNHSLDNDTIITDTRGWFNSLIPIKVGSQDTGQDKNWFRQLNNEFERIKSRAKLIFPK